VDVSRQFGSSRPGQAVFPPESQLAKRERRSSHLLWWRCSLINFRALCLGVPSVARVTASKVAAPPRRCTHSGSAPISTCDSLQRAEVQEEPGLPKFSPKSTMCNILFDSQPPFGAKALENPTETSPAQKDLYSPPFDNLISSVDIFSDLLARHCTVPELHLHARSGEA
jgi:hypothetical protein